MFSNIVRSIANEIQTYQKKEKKFTQFLFIFNDDRRNERQTSEMEIIVYVEQLVTEINVSFACLKSARNMKTTKNLICLNLNTQTIFLIVFFFLLLVLAENDCKIERYRETTKHTSSVK